MKFKPSPDTPTETAGVKQGRPKVPIERKKKMYQVYLVPPEVDLLNKKYGSLTLAIRSLLVQDKPETVPAIKQVIKDLQVLIDGKT